MRKGDNDSERLKDANENILRRRNAEVNGPVYTYGSSMLAGISAAFEADRVASVRLVDEGVEIVRAERYCGVLNVENTGRMDKVRELAQV